MVAQQTSHKSNKGRLGSFIYPMRVVGYAFAIASISLFYYTFYTVNIQIWVFCTLMFIYPHVAYFFYYKSGYKRTVEFNTLTFDMFFIGSISVLLEFSPIFALPYVIANSASNFASNGPCLFFRGLIAFALGVFICILFMGFHFHYQYNIWVSIPSYVYLLLASHYIGFISYVKGNILRKTKNLTETQNNELLDQKEELEILNQDIQNKHLELARANKNIKDSITYAKHIQGAILPRPEIIESVFSKYFIFYKPRDIVGGDFYWLTENQGNKILVVADCTGHGVPGAFMSLIGQMFLEETILKQKITQPAEVLTMMHQKVMLFLNQKYNNNQDGMDMAMVVYDSQKKVLHLAGAKSSVTYIQNNELHSVKGALFSVGHENYSIPVTFIQQCFSVTAPTRLYLYSDGFQDQFGGENNCRLGKKKFTQLLYDTQHLSLTAQGKMLENFFDNWLSLSNESQMDDVLVFGVELF